jgi:truncated hemoglobin YjbI
MQPLFRRTSVVVAACLLGFVLAAPAGAAGDAAPPDAKALDRYLYNNLRFIINHGVDLYNAERVDACYEHFRQSLQDLVPVLTHHPDLQKEIKDGLDKVEKDPDWRVKMAARATMPNPQQAPPLRQKAFALRAVFNDVRAGLSPEPKKPAMMAGGTSLWDRLGGEAGVRKIVDDFATLVGADPKVDLTRGGKRKLDELTVADLKQKSVEFISANTGGPLKYTGKSLKEAHKGMGITNEQFDAAAADFKRALAMNNVKPADADALLRFLQTTRKDIVEDRKAEGETVRGVVTLNGKPLARGRVALTGKDGKAHADDIAADGSYSLEGVPQGAYKVSVSGPGVPARYADANTTPLTFNAAKGQNIFDIALATDAKPVERPKPEEAGLPRVPEAIAVPAGNAVLSKLQADGVQVYESKARTGGGFEWVLKGPEAELKALGSTVGKHYGSKDGPVWEIDGDRVTGELPPKKAEVAEGNLPWLLLKVKDVKAAGGKAAPHTPTYVQRIDTEGGLAPARAPEKAGEETKVKYRATYVIYAAEPGKAEEKQAGEVGTVSGKVTYKGQPVPGGTITFHPKEGKAVSAQLQEDGTYSADKVPAGDCTVTVETESVRPTDKPKAGAPKYVPIPAKYAGTKTSGLTYNVQKGTQALDISLE